MTALFFKFFHIQRTRISKTSRLTIGSHALTFNQDAIVRVPAIASVDAPFIFTGKGTPDELKDINLKGKAVATELSDSIAPLRSNVRQLVASLSRRADVPL